MGYPDYQPAQTGVTRFDLLLDGLSGINVPAGQQVFIGPVNITGSEYLMFIAPQSGAGSTVPFCTLSLWDKFSSGGSPEQIDYDLPMSSVAYQCAYKLAGPVRFNPFQLSITNHDTVDANVIYSVYQANTSRQKHYIKADIFNSIPGFSIAPNASPDKGILGTWYQSGVGANGIVVFMLPPTSAEVTLALRGDTPADAWHVTMAPLISENNFGGLAQGNSVTGQTDANGNLMLSYFHPRTALILNVTNLAAVANNFSIGITFDVSEGL